MGTGGLDVVGLEHQLQGRVAPPSRRAGNLDGGRDRGRYRMQRQPTPTRIELGPPILARLGYQTKAQPISVEGDHAVHVLGEDHRLSQLHGPSSLELLSECDPETIDVTDDELAHPVEGLVNPLLHVDIDAPVQPFEQVVEVVGVDVQVDLAARSRADGAARVEHDLSIAERKQSPIDLAAVLVDRNDFEADRLVPVHRRPHVRHVDHRPHSLPSHGAVEPSRIRRRSGVTPALAGWPLVTKSPRMVWAAPYMSATAKASAPRASRSSKTRSNSGSPVKGVAAETGHPENPCPRPTVASASFNEKGSANTSFADLVSGPWVQFRI